MKTGTLSLQAGTEIEVSLEMIEAGEMATYDVLYEPLPERLTEELVSAVYRAMRRASPSAP